MLVLFSVSTGCCTTVLVSSVLTAVSAGFLSAQPASIGIVQCDRGNQFEFHHDGDSPCPIVEMRNYQKTISLKDFA